MSYRHISSSQGAWEVFRRLLNVGKSRKQCPLCTRDMNHEELQIYEQTVSVPDKGGIRVPDVSNRSAANWNKRTKMP